MGGWLKLPRRLRFTREGKWFVILVLAIGITAINTGINLLYLVLATMLSLIVTSGLLSEMSLRKVHLSLSWPSYVFAGQEFLLQATLTNGKRFLPSFSLSFSLFEDPGGGWRLDKGYAVKIPAGGKKTLRCRGLAEVRGLYAFRRFRLATRFPFGLFEKSVILLSSGTVLAYPCLGRISPPFLRQLKAWSSGGAMEDSSSPTSGREEFHALREYQPGDNPRWIHWRTSARLGRLLVKEFKGSSCKRVVVLLDTRIPDRRETARAARLERGIRFVATLARDLVEEGYPVSVVAYAPELQWIPLPGRDIHPLLRALALLRPQANRDLETLWGAVAARIPGDALTVVVSLGPGARGDGCNGVGGYGGRQMVDVSRPDFDACFKEE